MPVWLVFVNAQFGQTPNSAVFRYRKSRVGELPNSEVFVLFPLLASVCYNVWNIECLENLWGKYVRKWLNLLKIDDNSWQSKKNRAVVSIRVPKGKRVRKLLNSEVQRPQDFRYRKTAEFGVCPKAELMLCTMRQRVMGSESCDFGRHFDDAAGKIDSCEQSFGKAEPLECVRVSRDSSSRMWIFFERLSEMWAKTRALIARSSARAHGSNCGHRLLRSEALAEELALQPMRARDRRVQDRCE